MTKDYQAAVKAAQDYIDLVEVGVFEPWTVYERHIIKEGFIAGYVLALAQAKKAAPGPLGVRW